MPLVLSKPDVMAEFCDNALAARLVLELKLEHAESAAARKVGVEVADIEESCTKITQKYFYTEMKNQINFFSTLLRRF